MKKCPYCKVEVGGNPEKCPLCQSKLMGEGDRAYFPVQDTMKFRSFLYQLQLFIVWVVIIACLGLDFLVHLRLPGLPELHWSLLVAMWLVAFEFLIMRQFKPGMGSARKVTMMVLIILAMLSVTAYFLGFLQITLDLIVPVVITGAVIANFVLAMVDKNGNAMAYLLSGLLCGVIPSIVLFIVKDRMPVAWMVCMIVSLVLFAGVIIFKGRLVAGELQRRFNV